MSYIPRTSKTVPTDMTWDDSIGLTEYNKWWYDSTYSTDSASICLPNCTTYAMGRSAEIAGETVEQGANRNPSNPMLNRNGFGNAADWFSSALWETGQTPKLGAIACWTDNGKGWGGHVAIVESTDGTNSGSMLSMSGYTAASSGTRSFSNPGSSASWYFKYLDFDTTNYYYTTYNDRGGTFLGYIYNPYVLEHDTPSILSKSLITDGNIKYIEWKNSYEDGDQYRYKVTVAMNPVVWGGTNNRFNLFTTQPNSDPGDSYELAAVINGNIWGTDGTTSYPMGFTKVANESVGTNGVLQYLAPETDDNLYTDVLAIGSTASSGGSTLVADLYQNMAPNETALSSYLSALNGDLTATGNAYCARGAYVSAIHSFIGYNNDNDTAFMGFNSVAMTGAAVITAVKNIFGSNSKVAVLDGGGSTQMLLDGNIVRASSDDGGVRLVENAICIYRKSMIEVPTPVSRDETKNQVLIVADAINIRTQASTSSTKIGTVTSGQYYNVLSIYNDGTYTWYQIGENAWIADNGSWVTYLPITVYYTVNLSVNDETMGSVSGADTYKAGSTVTITATPNDGYKFKNWLITSSELVYSTEQEIVIDSIAENLNLTAVFESAIETKYTLTVVKNIEEGGVVTGDGEYVAGKTATLSVTLNQNYGLVGWYKGDELLSAETTFYYTVNSDTEITIKFELLQYYTVTTSSLNDNITVTGGGEYLRGTKATITATSNGRANFKNFTVNGTEVTTNPYEFTVNEQTTIVANGINTYTIALSKQGEGTINDISGTYEQGTEVMLEAEPADRYRWIGWYNNNTASYYSTEKDITISVEENLDLTAVFEAITYYTVNVTADEGITVITTGTEFEAGTTCTVTAEVTDVSKIFGGWYSGETKVESANPFTFTVNEDTELTAKAEDKYVVITVKSNDEAKGEVEGAGKYKYGTEVTVEAKVLSIDYEFKQWTYNGNVIEDSTTKYTFTAIEDATLVAEFVNTTVPVYTITLDAVGSDMGTVTGAGRYKSGITVTISATPASGYKFVGWKTPSGTTYESTENPHSFIITGDVTLSGVFEVLADYTITVTAEPSEAATVTGGGIYKENSTATLEATIVSPYVLTGWSGIYSDQIGDPMDNPVSFTVTGNKNVVAKLRKQWTITTEVNNTNWGTISNSGACYDGNTFTVTWASTNLSKYVFDKLLIDGEEATITVTNSYTFTPTKDTTVKVYFKPIGTTGDLFTLSTNVVAIGSNLGMTLYDYDATAEYKIYWYDDSSDLHEFDVSATKTNLELPIGEDIEKTMSAVNSSVKNILVEKYIGGYLAVSQTDTFTALIPNTLYPTITYGELELDPDTLFNGKAIAGKTEYSMLVTFDMPKPNGYNSATIVSYSANGQIVEGLEEGLMLLSDTNDEVTNDSKTIDVEDTFAASTVDSTFTVNATVTDSRSNTVTSNSSEQAVYGYYDPQLTIVDVYRCKQDGSWSENAEDNTYYYLSFTIDYASVGGTNEVKPGNVSIKINGSTYTPSLSENLYKAIIGNGELIPTENYIITITYIDTVRLQYNPTDLLTFTYETADVMPLSLLHKAEEVVGAAFGIKATMNKTIQMGLNTLFTKNTNMIGATEKEEVTYSVTKPAYDIIDRGGINSVAISNEDITNNTYANNQRVMDSTTWNTLKTSKELDDHTLYFLTDTTGLK